MVLAMTGMTAATSAVRLWAARALFGLRRFDDAGWRARAEAPRCWLRLAQQDIGAVRRPLVGLSVPIMARVCQRESDNGPNWCHGLPAKSDHGWSHQSIALIAAGGEDGRIGPFVRCGPLPLTQAVPRNISTGPCGPGGAPYGRTEYGRSRRSRGRSPGDVKGLKPVSEPPFLSGQTTPRQ